MKNWPLFACVATVLGFASPSLPALAATATTAGHCSAPTYRQFDFWLGDWDTYRVDKSGKVSPDAASVARNHVTSILDQCVLHEVYQRTNGYTGESFTIYDATRHVWHQSWVTNEGELLTLEGTKQGSSIVLVGTTQDAHGKQLQRVTWTPQGDGVRETAVQSQDDGKTWTPSFDILFRPHRS